MSQAYQRFSKRKAEGQKKQPAPKYNIHKISFDDSQDSSRSDIPNIYLAERSESQIPSLPMRQKKRDPPPPKQKDPLFIKQDSYQQLQVKKQVVKMQTSPKKRIDVIDSLQAPSNNHSSDEAQSSEQQQIPQPQVEIEPHTSLSIFEIIKLYLGQYLFRNPYPMKKAIYINNNNEEENQINKKEFQIKFKNDQKEISHFDNTITIGKGLFISVLAVRNVFTYFYIYAWIAVLVIQSIAQAYMLNGPIQYGTQKTGLIVLIILAILFQLLADILSVRKRRLWEQNKRPYKVYHHNGKMAEWANIKAHQLKPGHIYKVSPGEFIPTDCVLLHSQHSLVHIKQSHIISGLVQSVSEVVLKETLIKGQSLNLPFSGAFTYEISNPEYSDFQIIGKLVLEEPNQANHPVSMSQIILRGSMNYSDVQILCFAMETGIDSILLKNLQYPYQHLKTYEESPQVKLKVISDQVSSQIKQRQNTLIGVPIESKIQSTVYAFTFIYIFLSGLGVLVNFFYRLSKGNQFYLAQKTIPIGNILLYHVTNYIIFIPILLIPIFKLFVLLSGLLAESNISRRPVDLIPDSDKSKRATTFTGMKDKEELLDNKKIIFPVRIKDHNVLHQLSNIDTIITTIDTFRDQSAYTLHSVKVKEIMHNFANNTNADMYSIQDIQDIKKFMSFAVLTTSKDQFDDSYYFDDGIQLTARKYLDIKKVKNAYGELLINNNDQIKVKLIFSIKATHQYPYKVVFLEPVLQQHQDNPEILVLIRGDTKTILDKAYGKQISLTVQARKLHQEKDFYVELMAKTSMRLNDALEIQRAYNSNSIQKTFFYKNLDKYISKVQPMGLLVFVNNFFQKKVGDTIKNPILNKSIISQQNFYKSDNYDADVYASQHLPTLIVLSPPSKSSQPQFESIHTIKNLLINSYLFNFSLSQVSQKIIQQKPSNLQKMMQKLQTQRVLVWDGWDQKDITYTIDIMKKYGKKVLFYIQKDEYMYLMKESDCSVKGSRLGYDSNKYSDITLSSRSSVSYFYLMQLIRYDALVVKEGLLSIFFTQLSKFIFYLIIQFINLFFTRGTGLAIIRTPLYLVVELTLSLDIFYYLNWSDSMRSETFNKKDAFSTQIFVKGFHTLIQGIFITLISIYSLQNPPDSTGAAHSYHFPYFIIVFILVHILVFQKIFNMLTYSLSIYKMVVIAVQILVIYLGFIIVSATDTYGFKAILWNSMNGKKFITAVLCIWICLTLPAIRMLLHLMRNKSLKKNDKTKKTF